MLSVVEVLYYFLPLVQVLALCPPFQAQTVKTECWLGGRSVDCTDGPAPPETTAKFSCRPGHQLPLVNLSPSQFQARCGADGQWSRQPFRCDPVACPPLQLRTVVAECRRAGRPVNCTDHPVAPGTKATFRCKPGYKVKHGYSPDTNFESRCDTDGSWTEGPFRCEPEVAAAPQALTQAAVCPPLESRTVTAECRLGGRLVDCAGRAVPPGTRAKFRCKPLHQFLFGYSPDSDFESRCGADGRWSERPFRCQPICGQPTGKGISFIRDGNVSTSAADFPWHVIIYDLTKGTQICGGTLISTKYFVSAAHCFHDGKRTAPEAIFRAGFGKIKRSVTSQEVKEQYKEIEKIHIKDYGGSKELFSNDISLVELREEVDMTSSTMPACVDWGFELPDLRHGERGAVVGFGDTAERAHDTLHFALLPFVKSAECKRRISDSLAVYNKLPDKFCIGFVNRTTVAKGDSGGGIAFPNEERVWFLRGVVSLGSSQETTYSFFTNITSFVPWMSGIIQRGEVTGRRCGVDVNDESVEGGAIAGQFDFPWEVVVYYKQTSSHKFERLTTGALIRPNLVVTRAKSVTSTGQPIDLAEYPSAWLRVAPRRSSQMGGIEKASNVSEVVRGFFPGDVLAVSGLFYNILVLELKQPLNLMPVCLDWTGSTLLQKERQGTTLSEYELDQSATWTRHSILNATSCKQTTSVPLASHNICTLSRSSQPRSHNSLYVYADNTWFLRGVQSQSVVSSDSTVFAYTDLSDPGVRKWLSKTRDMIGRPTCGNINLCEPLSSGLSLRGHMPWNVAVVVGRGTSSSWQGSGILVQSNAVLTDSAFVVNVSRWQGDGNVPTRPTESISVLWTSADGSSQISQVVRVSVRESADVLSSGQPRLDIALLELDQPVLSSPVCLDFTGTVLQQLAAGQLGLVEAWSSWGSPNHSLVSVPFMGPAECSAQLRQSPNRSRESNEFCTSAAPGVLDSTVLGGAYLVSSGSQWFLQGLYTGLARLRHRTVGLLSDFRDDALKGWLKEELRKVKPLNSKSSDDSGPKNCVGGRPSPTDCGLFNSKDELQDDTDFLYKKSRNRMEWNVQVHVNRGDPLWDIRAGVLVRTTMVLTTALNLFVTPSDGVFGTGQTIPTRNVLVKYITADGRGPFSEEVRRIHIKERCVGCPPRPEEPPGLHFDVALLELSAPVTLMPVCVPKPGWVAAPLNPLTEGLVEVWEETYSSQRTLVPTLFRTLGACAVTGPIDFLNAEFCTQPTTAGGSQGVSSVGAAFSVLSEGGVGGWFLRGIQGTVWNTSAGGTVPIFYNVDEPGLREWLQDKMQMRAADGSAVPVPVPKPQPMVATAPSTTTKCGQTTSSLFTLADNHTLAGPLPWSVAIYIGNNEKAFTSGVLLRDDVVLTDANMLVAPGSTWNDSAAVHTVDPADVRVMWVSNTGRRYGSQVVAVHARERDRGSYSTSRTFDVALLRLRKPFANSVVACWDQDMPKLQRYQLGVTDAWDVSVLDFDSNVLATPYVNLINDHCIFKNTPIPRLVMTMDRYCTGPVRVPVKAGAGFLVRKGDSWFVHGILSFLVADGDNRWVITDVAEEGVSSWIQQHLADKPALVPNSPPAEPSTKPPQLGGCGTSAIPLDTLAENGTLADHMPWSAVVYRKYSNGTIRMSPGVLVRSDTVLTDASLHMASPSGENGSITTSKPDTSFVVWFSPSGRQQRSNVLAIHVYAPSPTAHSSGATFKLALLRLGAPFLSGSAACLDLSDPSSTLASPRLGIMEAWNGDPFMFSNTVVATAFQSNADCRGLLQNANITSDMFCTPGTREIARTLKPRKGVKVSLDIRPGAGFLVRDNNSWVLRGLVAFPWELSKNHLAVLDLQQTSVKAWLRKMM